MSEQDALNIIFPNDTTKTISDAISGLTNVGVSAEDAKSLLRQEFPSVTDWSF